MRHAASYLLVATAAVVVACSRFESGPAADADADAAAMVPPVTAVEGGVERDGAADGGANDDCVVIADVIDEGFEEGLGVLAPAVTNGGTVSVDGGVLESSVPPRNGARALAQREIKLPTAPALARVDIAYSLGALVATPGFFVTGGCIVVLRNANHRVNLRFEITSALRLDDYAEVDGGVVVTGGGPEVALLTATPQTVDVRGHVELGPVIRTTMETGGESFQKITPLGFAPTHVSVGCGLEGLTGSQDAGGPAYKIHVDDLRVRLCAAPQ